VTLSSVLAEPFAPPTSAILKSSLETGLGEIRPKTFSWVRELSFRNDMLIQLHDAPLLSVRYGEHWLSDPNEVCEMCKENRFRPIREKGLRLMLELSDARLAASEGRAAQETWVALRAKEDLMFILVVSWIASRAYDYHAIFAEEKRQSAGLWQDQEPPNCLHEQPDAPLDPGDRAELQCVYREMALRHGPYFLWSSIFGNEQEVLQVQQYMEQGLKELKLYEMGLSSQKLGLQAIVFNAIGEKSGQGADVWIRVMNSIYDMMAESTTS